MKQRRHWMIDEFEEVTGKDIKMIKGLRIWHENISDPDDPLLLDVIAYEIQDHLKRTKRHVYEIGRLLVKAKQILGHGRFQDWIQETFDFSYQTAWNFMNVYKCCLGYPDLIDHFNTSILYQLSAPDFDPDLRDFLLHNANNLDKKSVNNPKRLKALNNKIKTQEIDLEDPEVLNLMDEQRVGAERKHFKGHVDRRVDDFEKILLSMARSVVRKVGKDDFWSKYEGTLVFTTDQADRVDRMINEACRAISSVKPEYELVDTDPEDRVL